MLQSFKVLGRLEFPSKLSRHGARPFLIFAYSEISKTFLQIKRKNKFLILVFNIMLHNQPVSNPDTMAIKRVNPMAAS